MKTVPQTIVCLWYECKINVVEMYIKKNTWVIFRSLKVQLNVLSCHQACWYVWLPIVYYNFYTYRVVGFQLLHFLQVSNSIDKNLHVGANNRSGDISKSYDDTREVLPAFRCFRSCWSEGSHSLCMEFSSGRSTICSFKYTKVLPTNVLLTDVKGVLKKLNDFLQGFHLLTINFLLNFALLIPTSEASKINKLSYRINN